MSAAAIKIENATVHASAGSGKTYLLVSRVVQLLLNGVEPGTILAITFTRKAAAEMQQRLLQRLFELAAADNVQLAHLLEQLNARPEPQILSRARLLYEQLLSTEHPVTTTTFHAFCQDLLRRFPLEADVPAGFELLEQTGALQDEAWEALMAEAAAHTTAPLAGALQTLFARLNLNNTRQALVSFVQQRSDWWAWTATEAEPLAFARQRLAEQLGVQPDRDPLVAFFADAEQIANYRHYLDYILKRDNKTNQKLARQLQHGLDDRGELHLRFQSLRDSFVTQKGTVRACKSSKEMLKLHGEQGTQAFIALHAECAALILSTTDQLAAQHTWQTTCAWYLAGQQLLQHYQRIKQEQRLLDFTDLEWKSYQLLTASDNARWVQYKLDNRIRHLLIDEFQDTNPTQWQLVLPLLEEFADKQDTATNTVFLVGDAKQSIYRFRRAEPRLFNTASDWLQHHMQSKRIPLNKSWRSSPAIMSFVNTLFGRGPLQQQLMDFQPHETEHHALWGQVNLLPLIRVGEKITPAAPEFRNPLTTPLPADTGQDRFTEGQQVADIIRQLVEQQTPLGQDAMARAIRYSDILILMRSRTHVSEFEQALRQQGIPYLGAERGTLLEALEVIDMVMLLQWLLSPYDNHALAGILRSPLFAVSDDELCLLAGSGQGNWQQRLSVMLDNLPTDSPLRRAHLLLNRWQQLAGHIPVHDLLDRIYSEANVLQRYTAAFPPPLKTRVTANLIRFLELALEIDSGRYPSLTRFIKWLDELRQKSSEAPNEPPSQGQQDRVRLLTIHESKGLEAGVVFLVDSARPLQRNTAYEAMVDWADSQHRPETFLLTGKKDELDPYSRQKLQHLFALQDREEANLLYVAVTRAKQMLFISGTEATRKAGASWYESICLQYGIAIEQTDERQCLAEAGSPPKEIVAQHITAATTTRIDPRLCKPVSLPQPVKEIAPSHAILVHDSLQTIDEDGRQRGLMIHAMLDHMTRDKKVSLSRLAQDLAIDEQAEIFQSCLAEVRSLLRAPHLQSLFDKQCYLTAYNEVPISYEHHGRMVYGIIDRLIVTQNTVLVLDYKTHRLAEARVPELLEVYRPQLDLYVAGIKKMWPEHTLTAQLLFTYSATLVKLT